MVAQLGIRLVRGTDWFRVDKTFTVTESSESLEYWQLALLFYSQYFNIKTFYDAVTYIFLAVTFAY